MLLRYTSIEGGESNYDITINHTIEYLTRVKKRTAPPHLPKTLVHSNYCIKENTFSWKNLYEIMEELLWLSVSSERIKFGSFDFGGFFMANGLVTIGRFFRFRMLLGVYQRVQTLSTTIK